MKLVLGLLAAAALSAATLQTTLTLQTPISNPAGVTSIVYTFSTNVASGPIGAADLTTLTMRLFTGSTLVYTDNIIAGGAPQPFGGATRVLSDIFWDFNLSSNSLSQMRNMIAGNATSATGTQFIVEDSVALPVDQFVGIARLVGGSVNAATGELLASQSTIPVPEPGTLGAAVLGALLILVGRRRTQA